MEDYLSSTATWSRDELSSTIESDDSRGSKGSKGFSSDSDYTAEKVVAMIALWGICMVTVMTIVSISLPIRDCGSKWKHQTRSNSGRTLFAFFIIALVLNLSTCIVLVDLMWDGDFESGWDSYEQILICRIFYDSGKWSMSMFFILRLHFIVKNTAFLKMRVWKLVVLVIALTATWALCLWGTLGVILDCAEPNSTRSTIQYSLIAVCDLIVTGYYCQRFVAVLIMRAEVQVIPSQRATISSTGRPPSVSMSEKEQTESPRAEKLKVTVNNKFVNLITKSTLLNLIGVLSSCMVIGYLLYLVVGDTNNPCMAAALRCLDGVINTLCIFLVFGFASKYYDFGCKHCHRRMRCCCKKLPKSAARRRHRNTSSTAQGVELSTK